MVTVPSWFPPSRRTKVPDELQGPLRRTLLDWASLFLALVVVVLVWSAVDPFGSGSKPLGPFGRIIAVCAVLLMVVMITVLLRRLGARFFRS
jgi:hypothetical protein